MCSVGEKGEPGVPGSGVSAYQCDPGHEGPLYQAPDEAGELKEVAEAEWKNAGTLLRSSPDIFNYEGRMQRKKGRIPVELSGLSPVRTENGLEIPDGILNWPYLALVHYAEDSDNVRFEAFNKSPDDPDILISDNEYEPKPGDTVCVLLLVDKEKLKDFGHMEIMNGKNRPYMITPEGQYQFHAFNPEKGLQVKLVWNRQVLAPWSFEQE